MEIDDESNVAETENESDYSLEDDLPWEAARKEKEEEEGFDINDLDSDDTVDISTLVIASVKESCRKRYRIKLVSRLPEKIAPIEILPKIEQTADELEIVGEDSADTFEENFDDVLAMASKRSSSHKETNTESKFDKESTKHVDNNLAYDGNEDDDTPTAQFVPVSFKTDEDEEKTEIFTVKEEKHEGKQESYSEEDGESEFVEYDEDLDAPKRSDMSDDISEYSIREVNFEYEQKREKTTNFNYPNEINRIRSEYNKSIRLEKIKIISIAVIALLLLVMENGILVNLNIPRLFNIEGNLAMYSLVDLQLFVIALALSYLEFFNGIKAIIDRKVSPESFCVTASLATIAFNIVLCIANVNTYECMFSFAATVILLLCHFSKYVELCAERATFESYSSQGDKLVAEIIRGEDVSPALRERFELDNPLKVMRIKKVGYVNGFLDRMAKKSNDSKLNTALIVASVSVSLVLGAIAMALSGELSIITFMSAFTASVMFTTASSIFVSHVLPLYILEKGAAKAHCAIVGEYSVNEYTSTEFVSFEDVEAFPTRKAKIKGIKIFGSDRPDDILYNMSGLFSTVGGPLDGIFRVSVSDLGMPDNIKIISVGQSGFMANVDGREFLVGRADYMEKNGITLFFDSDDETQMEAGNVSIMFLAENDELLAKFYVEYNISARFVANVKRLRKNGISSVIRTYDPNIDERLISKLCSLDYETVSVVKKAPENVNDYAQLCVDSGLVTGESSKDIIKMIFACFKAKKAIKAGNAVKIAATVVGVILAAAMVAMQVTAIPSVFMVLVSLLMLAPLAVLTMAIMK